MVIHNTIMFNLLLYTQCFPIPDSWYMLFRNYEEDAAMGGTAKCVRGTQTGPVDGDSVPMSVRYSPDVSL